MTVEENSEPQREADEVDASHAGAEIHLVDELSARIAELDAIAWNIPQRPKDKTPSESDPDPAA